MEKTMTKNTVESQPQTYFLHNRIVDLIRIDDI